MTPDAKAIKAVREAVFGGALSPSQKIQNAMIRAAVCALAERMGVTDLMCDECEDHHGRARFYRDATVSVGYKEVWCAYVVRFHDSRLDGPHGSDPPQPPRLILRFEDIEVLAHLRNGETVHQP